MKSTASPTNFAFLQTYDPELLRLGRLAENYFADDPNTCLLELRQLAEILAQWTASYVGLYTSAEESQYDFIRKLHDQNVMPREVAELFGEVRRAGNTASHAGKDDHSSALANLRITWQLGVWFHRTFQDAGFKSGIWIAAWSPTPRLTVLNAVQRLPCPIERC